MIDFHSHLSFLNEENRALFLENVTKRDIQSFILAGYDNQDWHVQKELQLEVSKKCKTNRYTYTAFGIHPWIIHNSNKIKKKQMFTELERLVGTADFLGELGLDFVLKNQNDEQKKDQLYWFENQLDLNKGIDKPLVLHIVRGEKEALNLLKNRGHKGLVHRYSGDATDALNFVDLGFLISIGPDLLSPRPSKLTEVVKKMPLDKLCIETDGPCSKQKPYDFELLARVAERLCEIKAVKLPELKQQLDKNLKTLLD